MRTRNYDWQKRFHARAMEWLSDPVNERMAFLLNVCPGGGKTRAAMTLCAPMAEAREAFLVVVAPSLAVSRQWVEAALRLNVHLVSQPKNLTSDFHGLVVTNQGLNNSVDDLIRSLSGRKISLIVDEAHHSSEENGVWGVAVTKLLEVAHRRLLLSGTAFRTDRTKIPYLRYEGGVAQPDFCYTYREAVRDRVNRSLETYAIDGHGGLSIDGDAVTYDISDAPGQAVSSVMTSMFRADGEWVHARLNDVQNSLNAQQQNASFKCAALIVCTDTAHANRVTSVLKSRHGHRDVECIHSNDERRTDQVIERFRRGEQSYLVAVDMISEGVDIPRLTTGLHLTPKRTELFLRQTVGRLLRTVDDHDEVKAAYIAPAHPDIRNILQNISNESQAGLSDRECVESAEQTVDRDNTDREIIILPSRDGPVVDAISHGQNTTVHNTELVALASAVLSEMNMDGVSLATAIALLEARDRVINKQDDPSPVSVGMSPTTPEIDDLPLEDRVAKLRSELSKLVGRIHYETGHAHSDIYTSLSKQALGRFVNAPKMTIRQLQQVITAAEDRLSREANRV